MINQNLEKIVLALNHVGVIKFGKFTLKSGIISPFYIDLRLLPSNPELLRDVALAYAVILHELKFDRMAGVPYAGLPLVGAISFLNAKPWIFTRKEVKDYGTKKLIEGEYTKGETVVLIDDLITSGLSKFESLKPIEDEGLTVKDVVVLIDREQGGKEELEKKGYKLHSIFTITQMLQVLVDNKKISQEKMDEVRNFLNKTTYKK